MYPYEVKLCEIIIVNFKQTSIKVMKITKIFLKYLRLRERILLINQLCNVKLFPPIYEWIMFQCYNQRKDIALSLMLTLNF